MEKINNKIKEALEKIDFVNRYKTLIEDFTFERAQEDNELYLLDFDDVVDLIVELGYPAYFNDNDKLFLLEEENEGNYSFKTIINLRGGEVDVVWIVRENGNMILGTPLAIIYKNFMRNTSVEYPNVGSEEDINEVLGEFFKMYEDLKTELIELIS